MPIYMDRHDVSEIVTAEYIAQLHQEDLKIQQKFGCRGLTYWFDDKRKTAFCLIEAPDPKAIKKMHDEAHGQVPHRIIEVEPSIVESFLGRIEDPKKSQNTELNIINDPAFRIIMVISLNRLSPIENESTPFNTLFVKFNQDIRKILKVHDGNTVTQTDYHYLVSFKSVSNAVDAASKIQAQNKAFNKKRLKGRLLLKIGLSAGVPVTKKKSIFEDTIKLATRMCDLVQGEIIVSTEVRELYESENTKRFIKGKAIYALSPSDENFITLLMDYTDDAWSHAELKVDHFTKPLGYSKSQFYRKMVSLTGKSPNFFIMEYRLKEALKLLRKNAGNISEVAFKTGFSSPSYFTKCFKSKFGVLPAIYLGIQQRH
jgi:AraC-like DNA-binding protein